MSEEGLNKGQGQDQETKTPFFDSSEISKKENVEHFTNVAGAEERAKAAERAKKAAEAEAREVHEADVRAASEQMKKAENGEKKGIIHFLFGGWHKFVTIATLLLIIAVSVYFLFFAAKNDSDLDYKAQALQYYEKQKALCVDADIETYAAAREEYEERYNSAEDAHQKFYEGYYYALFVYYYGINFYDSFNIFNELPIPSDVTSEEACDLRNATYTFYEDGDFSENEKLKTVIEGCHEEK